VATTRRKRQCTTYHRWRTAQDARSETEGGPAYHSKTASNPDERNRTGRLQALPPEHSRLHGTQRTHWLSEEQPPDQDTASMYGRESAPQRREKSARRSMEASAAPVSAPVTADTRRHSAAADDSESGAERHPATVPDTARHRPTRRIGSPKPQVASSIPVPPAPRTLNSSGLQLCCEQRMLRALTPT
jgi:hypothetical protein